MFYLSFCLFLVAKCTLKCYICFANYTFLLNFVSKSCIFTKNDVHLCFEFYYIV